MHNSNSMRRHPLAYYSTAREQHPLVEITLSQMNNRAQVEAVLNGSIMLGIGYFSYALEEDEQEQVSTRLLLRSVVVIVRPKNRRLPKGALPKLRDFRHEKFLSVDRDMHLDTSNGCVTFANDSADLNQKLLP